MTQAEILAHLSTLHPPIATATTHPLTTRKGEALHFGEARTTRIIAHYANHRTLTNPSQVMAHVIHDLKGSNSHG